MGKYRKKPGVVFEAMRWDGETGMANSFVGEAYSKDWEYIEKGSATIVIRKLQGDMIARLGDWILKGDTYGRSEVVCVIGPDVFEALYERAEEVPVG